ncbi:hypothetical protein S7711_06580 [Stachybotrys chartarum IBT 7711]|uniref:Integral membrane protein n=1 Tax=Stachybotrys chartarum (strain CBS 109288 / IBT 7711) TaxID=1280523 RepID=A0A084AYN3_STACB|nr:hypothetical protein S7711_06580 [Stachybotrys chartarum IBT 7711]
MSSQVMTPPRRDAAPRAVVRSVLQLQQLPAVLRPLVRAYVLGYVSAVTPRLLALILKHVLRRRTSSTSPPKDNEAPSFLKSAAHVLKTASELDRFPTFCAVLAGGTALLQVGNQILDTPNALALLKLPSQQKLRSSHSCMITDSTSYRFSRWLATFVAAWLGLRLLQSRDKGGVSGDPKHDSRKPPAAAGRTLDLTLFAATRAVDVIVGGLWERYSQHRRAARRWTRAEQHVSELTDPLIFSASCALIMWSWFFSPEKLPRSYAKWITTAAQVDQRLIEALRRCLKGELRYGEDTGQAPLLQAMCDDYGWPREWGDPAKSVPFPCEMVHMGCGPSCEYHALSRFFRAWTWSMLTYVPISLALWLRKPNRNGLAKALKSASRSSMFLGMFIALFYYGVCLARTRVGPHVIGKDATSCQRIDGGICVATGCVLCGWSVLLETAGRRQDMALFVAPRALATIVPRRYPQEKQWRETLVFAASAAVVFTNVLENPRRVRGFLGRLLSMVMKQS